MLREQWLQQKLRRSGALQQKNIYEDFIQYAKQVKDEMEVYLYMEENGIGIQQAKYWIARLEVLRKRCELKELVNTIKFLKLQMQTQQLWEVAKYQREIVNYMRRVYNMQYRGKRKTKTFNNQIDQLHPQHRKIGNIEVYVDSHNRVHYEAEDLAGYLENNMPEYCQVEREDYKRIQEKKPLSFIAKKQQYLLDLAQQVISKNPRKSIQERMSLGQNKVNLRDSSNFEVENYNTPKNNQIIKTEHSLHKTNQLKEKRKKDSSRDSIQILKSMRKSRKESDQFRSPKFIGSHTQFQHHSPAQIIEKCRYKSGFSQQQQYFSFSFGRNNNRRPFDDTHSRRLSQKQLQNKDQAFLFNSFSLDPIQPQNSIPNEDFQLQLIINQIQRQRYEKIDNRTFSSEINSNQENELYEISTNSKQRKVFEKMLQTEGKMLNNCKSVNLQDLIDFDDDVLERNPETSDQYTSNYKKKTSQFQEYRSESKNKLSHILEQSHFYSQSKLKSRKSK